MSYNPSNETVNGIPLSEIRAGRFPISANAIHHSVYPRTASLRVSRHIPSPTPECDPQWETRCVNMWGGHAHMKDIRPLRQKGD